MKVWDRYAEYAIIGGFFWIGIFIAIIIVSTQNGGVVHLDVWAEKFKEFNGSLNLGPVAVSVITSLLSALGVIAVFWAGMVIDIISPVFFTPFEIFYFKRYILKENCNYIEKIFGRDKTSSMYRDYEQFSVAPVSCRFKYFSQWSSHRHRYIKLLTLLISYCLKNSETGVLEDLKDRLVLWRTGRALGGSIFLLAITVNCLLIVPSREKIFEDIFFGFFIIIILWIFSALLAMGQYIRLCNTLRSIMYLLD